MKVCPRRIVLCGQCGISTTAEHDCKAMCPQCCQMVFISKYERHISTLCTNRKVRCSDCNKIYTAGDLPLHQCQRQCPQCLISVSSKKFEVHRKTKCNKRMVACSECKAVETAEDFRHHKCPVTCEECGLVYEYDEETNHVENECLMREYDCRDCGESFLWSDFDDHSCRVDCPMCGVKVNFENLDKHLGKCPHAQVECKKCQVLSKRKDLKSHKCPDVQCSACGRHMPLSKLEEHVRNNCEMRTSNRIESEGLECLVCMDAQRNSLIMPCRHLACCMRCARRLRMSGGKCAVCRGEIRDVLEVYT